MPPFKRQKTIIFSKTSFISSSSMRALGTVSLLLVGHKKFSSHTA